jgi:hypothetical protein
MNIAMALTMILILSMVVEAVVSVLKKILPEKIGRLELPILLSIVVGIALAVLTQSDLLTAIGFNVSIAWVSWVVTGIASGGGSKVVHELISKIRASRQDVQLEDIDAIDFKAPDGGGSCKIK